MAYEEGKKIADITKSDIHIYLSKPSCFVWVALKDPTPEELFEMQHEFNLHELAVEDARHGHQRPKIEEYGNSLFAVLHTLETAGEDMHVGEVNIFVGANYVLSVRNRAKKCFASVRARSEREPRLLKHGSAFVLYALMDAVVDGYFPTLETLEERFEQLEEQIFGKHPIRENIEELYALRQRLITLKHAVAPLHDALGKLYGGRVPEIVSSSQEYFRDIADHLLRIDQSIDSLREMVTTAFSVNLSLITLAENETMKRLAAYAALIAVPTMTAGIYGMNFEHMPELKWTFGYPVTLGVMVILDAYLFYPFRKAKWL
ncbi:magnesium/cobalt transporter CorA [Nitrosococcus wardiae]|uniref:magnesium/cobalt transporter CorA n=1 Tax=Nitrosococcus wardiae TaxID=1814290 RepID=UPI001F10C4A7|nr:magnesium/cobalt transporter CorA [Nitrosococcus wardiae]